MIAKKLAVLACSLLVGATLVPASAGAVTRTTPVGSITGSGATSLTNPTAVAVDPSSHDIYVANPQINQRQSISVDATGGTFTLSFAGQTTERIDFNATARGTEGIEGRLEVLSTVGDGNVVVSGEPGGPYLVELLGPLGGAEQPQITADSAKLTGGSHSVSVAIVRPASPEAKVEKFTPSGEFVFSLGAPGSFATPSFLAVDPLDGDLYVGDAKKGFVAKYDSQGNLVTGWGTAGHLAYSEPLQGLAVNSAGDLFVLAGNQIHHYTAEGAVVGTAFTPLEDGGFSELAPFGLGVDSENHLYAITDTSYGAGPTLKFRSNFGETLGTSIEYDLRTPAAEALALDPRTSDLYLLEGETRPDRLVGRSLSPDNLLRGGNRVRHYEFDCAEFADNGEGCFLLEEFGAATKPLSSFGDSILSHAHGIAADADGTIYVADTANARVEVFKPLPAPQLTPGYRATSETAVSLEATVEPGEGGPITECQFEYGEAAGEYNLGTLPCEPAGPEQVQANLNGLTSLTTYHFRLLGANAQVGNSSGDQTFLIPLPPTVSDESASEITSDSAAIDARILAGGGQASYHVEYLTAAQVAENESHGEEEFAHAQASTSLTAGSAQIAKTFAAHLGGLQAITSYRYRVVVENKLETVKGAAQSFTTQPFAPTDDSCTNAHVRQQTSSEQLLDCRAYELVSAADAGGYDVESSLIPGQTPFGSYPDAADRVLYGVHGGGIPDTGHPTNHGVDPYLATRGANGWTTEYVGIPAEGTPSIRAFGSPLLEADSRLDTFAFGGESLCSPCFADQSTGVPVREPGGELVQGMTGPAQSGPAGESEGFIAQRLSADGSHLIFGSTAPYAVGGNDETGDISIYDRDLKTGETHVVSNQAGAGGSPTPLACLQGEGACHSPADANGISELAISANGSRILVGQKVSEDADGNPYYHLYMDVNDGSRSLDLTPGVISETGGPGFKEGVLFDGMSEDGSQVYFTTKDALVGEDKDTSADIYRAELRESGIALTSITSGTGGAGQPGNSNSCDPAANSVRKHWNTLDPEEENCGVVAIGGGGGVASSDGTIYFISPEQLVGSKGVANAPNLYRAEPAEGFVPKYVTTLESTLSGPQPPVEGRVLKGRFGSFADATGLAVDHQTGDVYVLDDETSTVEKFDRNGNPVSFTASGSNISGNKLTGTPTETFGEFSSLNVARQLAVDNDPSSSSYGDLYVPDFSGQAVRKFSPTGAYLSSITGITAPSGVAVDQANGHLYVSRFTGSVEVFDAAGNPAAPTSFTIPAFKPNSIAVDNTGNVYVATEESTTSYNASGVETGTLDANPSQGVAIDSATGDVYVDEGGQVVEFNSSGSEIGVVSNSGDLVGSVGVAVDAGGDLYATTEKGRAVAHYGPVGLLPSPLIDSQAVIDSVGEPATRHTADFQVSENGEFVAFPSALALGGAGEVTAGHTEIFRGDSSGALACVSCSPTGAPASGDATLAPRGLDLTGNGQVFFDTTDPLLLADTDSKRDVYEWEPLGVGNCEESSSAFSAPGQACLALVSAGTSASDSGLLGVTANGSDAFFFTRDSLVPQDENGPTMKIYDAREGGGFPFSYPPATCKASDECHGAASPAPGPLHVSSGTVVEPKVTTCKKGLVKRHGKCVRKPHHKRHQRKHDRHAKAHRGAHK